MNKYPFAAGTAVLLILLSSCSSSSTNATTTPPTSPGTTTSAAAPASSGITIKDFAYSGTLTVKPGQKVTVTNMDSTPHTLTDKGGKFDTGTIDGNGGTGTFTAPTQPGSYQLKCTFHPQMSGTLVVQG
jgi:plastocyanin